MKSMCLRCNTNCEQREIFLLKLNCEKQGKVKEGYPFYGFRPLKEGEVPLAKHITKNILGPKGPWPNSHVLNVFGNIIHKLIWTQAHREVLSLFS